MVDKVVDASWKRGQDEKLALAKGMCFIIFVSMKFQRKKKKLGLVSFKGHTTS